VLSRQIRRIHAEDMTVHVRSNASPLSLLNLLPGTPQEPNRGTVPQRIDALDVRGTSHLEAVRGFVPGNAEWPLRLRMTTWGDRLDPARRFRVVIGDTRQVPASSADALRRYVPRLPDELHGRIDADLGTLEVSGRIGSGTGEAVGFSGTIRLRDLSLPAASTRLSWIGSRRLAASRRRST
jgi:hypothetical protein